MDVELAIAALGWFALAAAHTTIGLLWVVPKLTAERLPSTPFGPPELTLNMLRFTWHVVSLVLVAFGVILAVLAFDSHADPQTVLLRCLAAFLVAATALAVWQVRRRPSSLLRLPVPFLFVVIAVMCWMATT